MKLTKFRINETYIKAAYLMFQRYLLLDKYHLRLGIYSPKLKFRNVGVNHSV